MTTRLVMICAAADCTNTFTPARSTQRYCRPQCQKRQVARDHRKRKAAERVANRPSVKCACGCGQTFKPSNPRYKYIPGHRKAHVAKTPAPPPTNGTAPSWATIRKPTRAQQMPVPLASEAERERNAAIIDEQIRRARLPDGHKDKLKPIYLGGG